MALWNIFFVLFYHLVGLDLTFSILLNKNYDKLIMIDNTLYYNCSELSCTPTELRWTWSISIIIHVLHVLSAWLVAWSTINYKHQNMLLAELTRERHRHPGEEIIYIWPPSNIIYIMVWKEIKWCTIWAFDLSAIIG